MGPLTGVASCGVGAGIGRVWVTEGGPVELREGAKRVMAGVEAGPWR
ncbi:hypothetical protein OIE13_34380 [Streptosporangium sp. NBC_01810]|nr:hypothetical protein [Streptosporangium sp. NBC_01810]WSA25932.1 hypothetical protein OIE13_34380 [Streptosporangium sp. NBC_01810]